MQTKLLSLLLLLVSLTKLQFTALRELFSLTVLCCQIVRNAKNTVSSLVNVKIVWKGWENVSL